MLFLVGLNAATAVGRYLFGVGLTWSDELLQYMLILGISLGAFVVSLRKGHLRMDLLVNRLPATLGRALDGVVTAASLAILLYVIAQSWRFLGQIAAIDQRSMAMQIPMTYPHSALLVGFALMALALLMRISRGTGQDRSR
jgi:TRAP-type transport system small permease protein